MILIPAEKSLEGRTLSKLILDQLQTKVESLKPSDGRPTLNVILIGDDPASAVYVQNKAKTCLERGFNAKTHRFPSTVKAPQIQTLIEKLNSDPNVHGILLQLPLPDHLDPYGFLNLITPQKDVDGFNVVNIGNLFIKKLDMTHIPCTAIGIVKLLEHHQIPISGQHVVVVGQSGIVGRPTSALMVERGATVTLCHKLSQPLERYTYDADILIVATGVKSLIKAKHIKKNVVIIDVGIHRTAQGLVGDVDAHDVLTKVAKLTPVPGGVGPMTIACLLENTWNAYERTKKNKPS